MAAGNKVYTASWQATVNAGLNFVSNFAINSVGREIKLKSILIDLEIIDVATGSIVPIAVTTGHAIILTLQNTGPVIANAFIVSSGAPYAMGNIIRLSYPGQYQFDCFYVQNNLNLTLQIDNFSAGQAMYNAGVIIETQEKTVFR